MSITTVTTHHLECDICHADGGTTADFQPQSPEDWRRLRNMDLCGACIGRMTLSDFLGYFDEAARQAKKYGESHAKARQDLLRSASA